MHLCATRPADDPNAGFGRRHLGVAPRAVDQVQGPGLDCAGFGVSAVVTVEGRKFAVMERKPDSVCLANRDHARGCGVIRSMFGVWCWRLSRQDFSLCKGPSS